MYRCLILVFSLSVFIQKSHQWSGNVCQYKKVSYATKQVCTSLFIWCWHKVTVQEARYSTASKCCTGWEHSGNGACIIPLCYPTCQNGGTCVAPNQCRCKPGNTGTACSGYDCSHSKPCYPGQCYVSGSTISCQCHSEFDGTTCDVLKSVQDPEITETKVRMGFWERGGNSSEETYGRLVYTTDESKNVTVWTSLARYNRYNVTAVATFKGTDLPYRPGYINRADTGLVSAMVSVRHVKKVTHGEISVLDENTTCSSTIDEDRPQKMVECSVTDRNYDKSLENGDRLTFTFSVSSGGFRELYDTTLQRVTNTEHYRGNLVKSQVVFNFDFVKPFFKDLEEAFQLDPEISKGPINLTWDSWTDDVSGIDRYTWEVFRLVPNGDGELTERDKLKPIIHKGINHTNPISYPPPYTPDRPGMYSFILEVVDKANNSVHMRRLALFDNQSSVTTDPEIDIFVSSSSLNKEFHWMTNVSDILAVNWVNHFRNDEHENGKFLNKVLEFSEKLIDHPPVYKSVYKANDDQDGRRTTQPVPNKRGIVSFNVSIEANKNGGIITKTPLEWSNVGLNTTLDILNIKNLTSGSTVAIWIRAMDILGHWKEEKISVTYDLSAPRFSSMVFLENQHTVIPFSSGLELALMDEESGIDHVELNLTHKSDGRFLTYQNLSVEHIQPASCTDKITQCYCPNVLSVCYKKKYRLPISNCWFLESVVSRVTKEIEMEVTVVNRAGLRSSKTHVVKDVYSLNGTKAYLGPTYVNVDKVGQSAARVIWNNAPSCFPRSGIFISYEWDNGNSDLIPVSKDAEYFDLTELIPGKSYKVNIIVDYGGVKSETKQTTFTTENSGVLGTVVIIGIVVGLLLIVVVLIVGLVLWRTGRAGAIVRRGQSIYRERRSQMIRNNLRSHAHVMNYTNNAYGPDDDIYHYGTMEFATGQTGYINKDNLALLEEINIGRFARIYKADYKNDGKSLEVVAKVLKDPPTEESSQLMKAKINFAATQVGEHRNVLRFIGAVFDNEALGPVMVLEYCGNGQLDKWLTAHQKIVNDDVLETMQTFALGVSRGMEYLAKKRIIHRRLAARNCLITESNEVKVSGFGPISKDETGEEDASKADRIPIKWTAPECLHSLKDANEKSDIWSFGITLWEIFSMGQNPYPGVRSRDLPVQIRNGLRLEKPEYAEEMHFSMMRNCWNLQPDSRPTFSEVVGQLEASFGIKKTDDDDTYYYAR